MEPAASRAFTFDEHSPDQGTAAWRLFWGVGESSQDTVGESKGIFAPGGRSISCPTVLQLKIKAVKCTVELDFSTAPVVSLHLRLSQYRGPGSQRKLRAPGSNSSPPLDQQEHRLLRGWPRSHHSFWIRNWCLVCQPAHALPSLRRWEYAFWYLGYF